MTLDYSCCDYEDFITAFDNNSDINSGGSCSLSVGEEPKVDEFNTESAVAQGVQADSRMPIDVPGFGTMKHVSMLYRSARVYYNECLKKYGIGCGQEYFLLKINERPSITIIELAQTGNFDNASATRAVIKLESLGYIRVVPGEDDKRVKNLFVTEAAMPVIAETKEIRHQWRETVLNGFTDAEKRNAVETLAKMSNNAVGFIEKFRLIQGEQKCEDSANCKNE
ncbi:MAG: MarR family transcriptional regulator [Clostridia bacterium]|nr:MarR family transcriptional regulator [Clostridia bacterium]